MLREQVFAQLGNELTAIKPRLCAEDQTHLEALRSGWDSVQTQLRNAKMLTCTKPTPTTNSGYYYRDRSRSMIDVLVACLACDLTRTASLQWSQALSNWTPGRVPGHQREAPRHLARPAEPREHDPLRRNGDGARSTIRCTRPRRSCRRTWWSGTS
jgi:hypothetical protein